MKYWASAIYTFFLDFEILASGFVGSFICCYDLGVLVVISKDQVMVIPNVRIIQKKKCIQRVLKYDNLCGYAKDYFTYHFVEEISVDRNFY